MSSDSSDVRPHQPSPELHRLRSHSLRHTMIHPTVRPLILTSHTHVISIIASQLTIKIHGCQATVLMYDRISYRPSSIVSDPIPCDKAQRSDEMRSSSIVQFVTRDNHQQQRCSVKAGHPTHFPNHISGIYRKGYYRKRPPEHRSPDG